MPVGAPPEHRASTIEGQVARVADIVAYVNHDIDDAVRAGILSESSLPKDAVAVLGGSPSERIGRLVTDVVEQTIAGGLSEIRMSDEVLDAILALRSFLFDAVYENQVATAEFGKAQGILGGLWEKVREQPEQFLDLRTVELEGARRGGPGFRRRNDRPLRRQPVRAVVHPETLGDGDRRAAHAIIVVLMRLDLSHIRQPETAFLRQYEPSAFAEGDEDYRVSAPVTLAFTLHKDQDRFRLVGTVVTTLELQCSRCLEPFTLPVNSAFDLRFLPQGAGYDEKKKTASDDRTRTWRSKTTTSR